MLTQQAAFATCEDLLNCIGEPISIDVETTGLNFWEHKLIGLGFHAPRSGVSGYIPTLDESSREEVFGIMQVLAEDSRTILIGHNVAFECFFLKLSPRFAACKFFDTMVMAHLEDSRQSKGLESCAARYLNIPETKRVYREAGRNQPIHLWPVELTAKYCVNDCEITWELFMKLWGMLKKLDLLALLKKDMRYLGLLIEAKRRGMLLDMEFLERAEKLIAQNVVLMERDLKVGTGQDFNWRSPKQLSKALYEGMGVEKPVNPFVDEFGIDRNKGKSAQFNLYNEACTNSFLLMEKAHHPLGNLVLDLRESDKLVKNYCRDWMKLADEDHVIHGNLNITGAKTGRLSSSQPNLQNMPGAYRTRETQSVYSGGTIRKDEYNLRQAFIARPGYTFLSVDFRQQEGRLFALISNDPQMIEFVKSKKDIHSEVAESAWGSRDKVRREWAKTISFSILYGATAGSIQHRLNKTPEEASAIMNNYYKKFPRILPFMNEVIRTCAKEGYVRNWAGRIWREEDRSRVYKATNFLCQGGGADLLSIGAMRCQDWLDAQGIGQIVSLIHDEMLFEIKNESVLYAAENLTKIAECEDIFDAPFLTEAKIGLNYGSLKEIT